MYVQKIWYKNKGSHKSTSKASSYPANFSFNFLTALLAVDCETLRQADNFFVEI